MYIYTLTHIPTCIHTILSNSQNDALERFFICNGKFSQDRLFSDKIFHIPPPECPDRRILYTYIFFWLTPLNKNKCFISIYFLFDAPFFHFLYTFPLFQIKTLRPLHHFFPSPPLISPLKPLFFLRHLPPLISPSPPPSSAPWP